MRDAPGTPNRKHSMSTKTKTSSKRNAAARSSLARGSGSGNCEEYLRRNLACAKACGAVAGLDKLRAQLNVTKYQPAWLKKALFEVAKRIEPLPAALANWRDSSPDSPYPNAAVSHAGRTGPESPCGPSPGVAL